MSTFERHLTLWARYVSPPPYRRRRIAVRWSFLGWANISQAGAFNTMHTHPGMTWSGVYYVDIGE